MVWDRRADIHGFPEIGEGRQPEPRQRHGQDNPGAAGAKVGLVVAELSPFEEAHVFARMAGLPVDAIDHTTYPLLASETDVAGPRPFESTVLDVRPRADFARHHRAGAVNMPEDELRIRAPRELDLDRSLLVDCSDVRFSLCEIAGEILLDLGANQVALIAPN